MDKKRGKVSPFHFRFTTSGDVISDRACAHDHFRHHHTAAAASAAIALTFHPKHEKRKQKTLAKRTNSH
jgi:hypothetical protein